MEDKIGWDGEEKEDEIGWNGIGEGGWDGMGYDKIRLDGMG